MVHSIEHEKYELALQITVIGYDLNVLNPTIPAMLSDFTLDQLTEKRDSLLNTIEEQIALDGFYEVPSHMDATWLATLMQTELGAYVDVAVGEETGIKTIHHVEPGTV